MVGGYRPDGDLGRPIRPLARLQPYYEGLVVGERCLRPYPLSKELCTSKVGIGRGMLDYVRCVALAESRFPWPDSRHLADPAFRSGPLSSAWQIFARWNCLIPSSATYTMHYACAFEGVFICGPVGRSRELSSAQGP